MERVRIGRLASSAGLGLLVLAMGHSASAQPARLSASAGYQDMVYTVAQNEDPLPPGFVWVCPDPVRGCQFLSASYSTHGLYFDLGWRIAPRMAVVGEWQWNRSKNAGLFGGDPDDVFPGLTVSVQQFTGGLRFTVTRPRFEPFAQFLIGAARVTAGAPGISESISAADLHVGGGVDWMFTRQVGVRGSASYTHLFTSEVVRNDLAHFGVGIVFKQ